MLLELMFAAILGQDAGPAVPPLSEAAAKEYKLLETEVMAFRRDFFQKEAEKSRKAAEDMKKSGKTGRMPAMRMSAPLGEFVGVAAKHAEHYAGTDDAVPFLVWLAMNAGDQIDVAKSAAKTLTVGHMKSAHLGRFVQMLPRMSERLGLDSKALLSRLVEENPYHDVKAQALFARSGSSFGEAEIGSDAYRAARADLARAIKLSPDASMRARIQGTINAREKLAVGMPAPDIEGEDLDGVSFKLSDYKGKVVMLDFWGDW